MGADGTAISAEDEADRPQGRAEICFLWEKAEKARRHELTAAAGRRVIARDGLDFLGRGAGVPLCGGLDTELARRKEGLHCCSDLHQIRADLEAASSVSLGDASRFSAGFSEPD